jgi:hypothetical protein
MTRKEPPGFLEGALLEELADATRTRATGTA